MSTKKIVPIKRTSSDVPNIKNGKVLPPKRRFNKDLRPREYLTDAEVEKLMDAAASLGRHRHRDRCLILLAYRHGLRVSELISLRWDMIDLKGGLLHVARMKNGRDSIHPIRGPEIRALRKLQQQYPDNPYLFVSENGGPMISSSVRKIITRAGTTANLGFPVHPHMLRHACGYKLANDGHDTRAIQHYLGHKNIQHTVRYTELAHDRFQQFWRD